MEKFVAIKTTQQIQRKWDSILCRFHSTKMRHKEAYYEIARFAIGRRFDGSRRELHVFVISLCLDRMVEFTPWKNKIGRYAKDDFKSAIQDHCKQFVSDCFILSPPVVLLGISEYKWKDLSSKRVMLQERRTQDERHTYSSKSGVGVGMCSDWMTVK